MTMNHPRFCKRCNTLFQKSLLLISTWREYFYSQPTHFSSQPKKAPFTRPWLQLCLTNKRQIYEISFLIFHDFGFGHLSMTKIPFPTWYFLFFILTLAADDELGSSNKVHITLRIRAPHNPSKWSIYDITLNNEENGWV